MGDRAFWRAAGVRAVRTMAQSMIAYIGSSTLLGNVDWRGALSAAVMGGILSILMAITTGLPEAPGGDDHGSDRPDGPPAAA